MSASVDPRRELTDLLLGELEPARAKDVMRRVEAEPALARELHELESLFAFLRRGEELEPGAEMDRAVAREIARLERPSLRERLAQVRGLFAYRFRESLAFRVAAVSLTVHLIAMAVLFQVTLRPPASAPGTMDVGVNPDQVPAAHPPARAFVARLRFRRAPHGPRLRRFGVLGQEGAIRRGLARLRGAQRPDGSFGGTERTAAAALALLAEGDHSRSGTPAGRALRRTMDRLLAEAHAGARTGALLAALVEDYALAYDRLREDERADYAGAIYRLIARVEAGPFTDEALVLARLADFAVPADRLTGPSRVLLGRESRDALLRRAPDRVSATALFARGPGPARADAAREWARPLFERALARLDESRDPDPVVLLTLQAPYRL